MCVATYDIYQQRKCFTWMKKETDVKFDIDSDNRLAAALYSTVSYNKNMSFWPACLGRCGQIKKFKQGTSSVLSNRREQTHIRLISLHHL